MKFNEYDTVMIRRNYNEQVKKGDIGAVIMVFNNPSEAYEVEFLDENGFTKAQVTLLSEDLEKVEG